VLHLDLGTFAGLWPGGLHGEMQRSQKKGSPAYSPQGEESVWPLCFVTPLPTLSTVGSCNLSWVNLCTLWVTCFLYLHYHFQIPSDILGDAIFAPWRTVWHQRGIFPFLLLFRVRADHPGVSLSLWRSF
jgi:hypothetical protein